MLQEREAALQTAVRELEEHGHLGVAASAVLGQRARIGGGRLEARGQVEDVADTLGMPWWRPEGPARSSKTGPR